MDVVRLNYAAGKEAMDHSDFATARHYAALALSLLPETSDGSSFFLDLYFLRAKAAYSCGNTDEAQRFLGKIIHEGKTLADKKDAYVYHFTVSIHLLSVQARNRSAATLTEIILPQDLTRIGNVVRGVFIWPGSACIAQRSNTRSGGPLYDARPGQSDRSAVGKNAS